MIGSRGRDLIRIAEGLRLVPYLCPAGRPTIGYGHTRGVTMEHPPLTVVGALAYLEEDLAVVEAAINHYVHVALTASMRDALASWVFNLGEGLFRVSTMLKVLNAGRYTDVPAEISKWVYSHDKSGQPVRLPGLVVRREDEAELFMADGLPQEYATPTKE